MKPLPNIWSFPLTIACRLFLWASLFYSCCMTGKKQGAIRLGDEENTPQEYGDETADDEAVARRLQAEDRNWQ
jgi:hypothetical protein